MIWKSWATVSIWKSLATVSLCVLNISVFFFFQLSLLKKFFLSDTEFWILKFDCIFPKVYQMSVIFRQLVCYTDKLWYIKKLLSSLFITIKTTCKRLPFLWLINQDWWWQRRHVICIKWRSWAPKCLQELLMKWKRF